jgi:hypothetical protein
MAETYTCQSCYRSGPWTDGQSAAAGDPVDEYWCQTCGEEQPLPHADQCQCAECLYENADLPSGP